MHTARLIPGFGRFGEVRQGDLLLCCGCNGSLADRAVTGKNFNKTGQYKCWGAECSRSTKTGSCKTFNVITPAGNWGKKGQTAEAFAYARTLIAAAKASELLLLLSESGSKLAAT
jgi:hypothetical protein